MVSQKLQPLAFLSAWLSIAGCANQANSPVQPGTVPDMAPAKGEHEPNSPNQSSTTVLQDFTVRIPLRRELAYEAFTSEIDQWWDHHFSEHPLKLVFEARPGGAFMEIFDAQGNGAEHARIIYAKRNEELRFVGPLGLSGRGVEFMHTLRFVESAPDETKIELHLELLGTLSQADRAAVEGVWSHFLAAYATYCSTRPKHALFRQSPVIAQERVGLGFFSHDGKGRARNHVHADDFLVHSAATLIGVDWWGHLEGSGHDRLEDLRGFTIRIHQADVDGSPGPVLSETRVTLAASQPAFTGRFAISTKPEKTGPREWRHHANLSAPLRLEADTTYFLSIAAQRREDDSEPWQWTDAELSNGHSFSRALDQVGWAGIQDTDSAFELILESP
jgi:hypothetical protein